jgi:glycosyltransferase involved in cell wall biosynthesis
MIIGIDAREIQNGVYTGIGRALVNFLEYFDRNAGEDRVVLFSAKALPFAFSAKIKNVVMKERWTIWFDQVQLAQAIKKEGVEVFYSPYYKVPFLAACRKVSAILDLMYLQYEPYRRKMGWFKEMYYRTVARQMARVSDQVLTCSEFSRQDIMTVYGINEKKIKVLPLSVADSYRPQTDEAKLAGAKRSFGIPGRYILYVGNFKQHKNVGALVKAFGMIANALPDVFLVLVGPRADGYAGLVKEAKALGLAERVLFPGMFTKSEDLCLLYSGAEVFVMPAMYEGFGVPVVEAMACGVPVVSSSATSLPEVVGDAGILVDPSRIEDLAGAVKTMIEDGEIRRSFIVRGFQRIETFKNDRVAGLLLGFLRSERW